MNNNWKGTAANDFQGLCCLQQFYQKQNTFELMSSDQMTITVRYI